MLFSWVGGLNECFWYLKTCFLFDVWFDYVFYLDGLYVFCLLVAPQEYSSSEALDMPRCSELMLAEKSELFLSDLFTGGIKLLWFECCFWLLKRLLRLLCCCLCVSFMAVVLFNLYWLLRLSECSNVLLLWTNWEWLSLTGDAIIVRFSWSAAVSE